MRKGKDGSADPTYGGVPSRNFERDSEIPGFSQERFLHGERRTDLFSDRRNYFNQPLRRTGRPGGNSADTTMKTKG
jgi:hypothetical protein